MSIDAINEHLLRAIGVGVALLDPDDLSIRFQNKMFGEWFDTVGSGAALQTAIPDLDIGAIKQALEKEGRYADEISFRKKRRTLVMALTLTRANEQVVVVECQNITRIRELESMIESYSAMVERNTRDLQKEKERVEKLLLNIMPRTVYEEYKTFGVVMPQTYENVSVLTLEFIDFNTMTTEQDAGVIVSEINDIHSAFDRIGEQFGCERIKTVGDAYISIAGLPEPLEDHQLAVAETALRFVRYLTRRNESHPHQWRCRIGLASGAVIGSVVGIQKYVYDVFGPAVNVSAKVRDSAGPMEIIAHDGMSASLATRLSLDAVGVLEIDGAEAAKLHRVTSAPAT